jgi:hypothetical protein
MTLLKRLKTLVFSLYLACSMGTAPLIAAGTTPLSLVQQFDQTAIGQPLSGCLLYFFVAGTVATPQNAFADFGLTAPLSNPLQCDQSGRVPQHWLADGLIHIRLTDSSGVVQIDTTMQVLGPSSGGGGGGGTVDPTTILATGDLKVKYGTGPISGFVRSNGLTIGNATCGCTERTNADTQNLFVYLYNADPNLAVSGGRTGNALNDYNANKQLTLPDWRGRGIAALDDMGNSAAGRLTATYFGTAATVLGAAGGNQSQTLAQANLPVATLVTTIVDPGHQHNIPGGIAIGGGGFTTFNSTNTTSTTVNLSTTGITASTALGGSNTPHSIVQPAMLATIYLKL